MILPAISRARDYMALTKPPIVALLLLTALGGMFLSAQGLPPWEVVWVVLVGGGMTAAGANAINHYMDRDIDLIMPRTSKRPLPRGIIPPSNALLLGISLNIAGFALLALGANLLSALLALGASLFYILVYTGWLKRSTPQNIVIGGAAGAMPPLVAAAAVTGTIPLSAFYLFVIIFLWTPPHFWALALLLKDDYSLARIPMLPVVQGEKATCWNILLYTFALAAISLLFLTTGDVGLIYLLSAVTLSALFIYYALRLLRSPGRAMALQTYKFSLLYLAALFLAVIVDSVVAL